MTPSGWLPIFGMSRINTCPDVTHKLHGMWRHIWSDKKYTHDIVSFTTSTVLRWSLPVTSFNSVLFWDEINPWHQFTIYLFEMKYTRDIASFSSVLRWSIPVTSSHSLLFWDEVYPWHRLIHCCFEMKYTRDIISFSIVLRLMTPLSSTSKREEIIAFLVENLVTILMGSFPLRIWIISEKSPCSHEPKSQK